MLYTIIDIETTGNGLKGNRITEISIFKFDGAAVVDEFTSLVNPQCPIPPFITGLTGIDDQMVASAPVFAALAETILDLTTDCIFVAHSVNFDYGVIKEEFKRLGIHFGRKKLCTVRLSRKLYPGLGSYSLGKLCAALNIPISNRHRAKGDAAATTILFKQLLGRPEADKTINYFLNAKSQEATLPPHLDRAVVAQIPHLAGIYYFLDQKGNIIYIGKAKDLKKRVLGHFYDKSDHEIRLCREVANINTVLSGSELIALLMESAAIKTHFPKFNRAQKGIRTPYGIFTYEDRKGICHLAYAKVKQIPNPLAIFKNPTECRDCLKTLALTHNLCPNYCQLTPLKASHQACIAGYCKGLCQEKEDIQTYNSRVAKALASLSIPEGQIVIKQQGRNPEETGFIFIENGLYKGYGFVPQTEGISSVESLEPFLILQKNTQETQQIIENQLKGNNNLTYFQFND